GMVGTGFCHAARGRPLAGGWVIEFGAGVARTAVADPAGAQHLAVREKRCCLVGTGSGHAAADRPLACSRVIQLGAGENCGVAAPGNQYLAVWQQCSGMAGASGGHAASESPGIGTPMSWDDCARHYTDGE